MAHESIVNLSNDNYVSEAEDASVPVVIDFWSEHCGPCKMLSPVLDEVAAEIGDAAKVTKVDVLACLLYTSPSPRDKTVSRMPSSA